MKIAGEFILRDVVGEHVLIPMGETALHFNGIISLNEVSACIWQGLEQEKSREELLAAVLEEFEVSPEEAGADLDEFLEMLRKNQLLED